MPAQVRVGKATLAHPLQRESVIAHIMRVAGGTKSPSVSTSFGKFALKTDSTLQ